MYHLGPKIHLLLEQRGAKGGGDHTTLMRHKYSRYAECMLGALKVDVDYRVVETKKHGRGLQSLRRIDKIGTCAGWYDGHRVNAKGLTVMRRAAVTELMKKYPQIDRELQNTPFQSTHAIRLGRKSSKSRSQSWGSHESGLLVDGGPLTHPCLDHVEDIGRMALANSGSPKDSNM